MPESRLTRAVHSVETSSLHWAYWVGTFTAFVIIRNLMESAFGPDRVFGFAHSGPVSALMVFDHFLLFYVSVFLSLAIILSTLSGERIDRVMRVLTPAWAIVLIPPPVDFLVSGGEGVHISYVLSLSGVLTRFFDPRVLLERVSIGQRVEVVAACVLALAYVRLKGRSWWRAGLAFVFVYLAIAAHGVLPSAYARVARLLTEGSVGLPAAAYNAAFASGGLVLEESRKLALLFGMTSAGLGWTVFAMLTPRKAAAFFRNLRPLRALHYVGMTTFGVALGWAVVAPSGFAFGNGGDILGIGGLLLATFLAFEASVGLNDLSDIESDRRSEPSRPLVTGALTERDAMHQFALLGAASLLLALNVKYASFLFLAMALLVSLLYSARPVRLKRIPLVATFSLGLLSQLSALVGFSAVLEARSLIVFPTAVGWLLVISFGLAFVVKDLKDVDGDRADGTHTLATLLGPRTGRVATAVAAAAGYLAVPALLPYRGLGWTAVALAAVNAVAVLVVPARRVVRPLLALYLVFALVAGVVIVRDVEAVLDAPAKTAASDQAALLDARSLERSGDLTDAATGFLQVQEPRLDQDGLVYGGVTLVRTGRALEGLPLLEYAVAREPASLIALDHLVAAHSEQGNPLNASAIAFGAVRRGLRPDVFLPHLAELDIAAGRPLSAAAHLAAALRAGRDETSTRIRRGDALALSGRADEALKEYELAAVRHPAEAAARDAYGRALHAAGRSTDALIELRAAVDLDPMSARVWNNLAVVHLALGEHDAALAALDRATELSPMLPDAYYNRGRVYEALGRQAEARNQYLLALEADSTFQPARQALIERASS